MSDEFTLDMSDVKASSFDALPTNWYLCVVTGAEDSNPTKGGPGAKLPAGTPGTNWEFTVDEGEYENRRVWTNHWHHPNTLGFMKTLLIECGAYTKEDFPKKLDIRDARDKAMDQPVWVKIKYKAAKGDYDEGNDVVGFRSVDNAPKRTNAKTAKSSSVLP